MALHHLITSMLTVLLAVLPFTSGALPDETTTIGEAPLTKPKVWFDARANKARITYPPGGGPLSVPPFLAPGTLNSTTQHLMVAPFGDGIRVL